MATNFKLFIIFFLCFNVVVLSKDFDLKNFGAKADGKTDDTEAFEDTWKAVCESSGPATMVVSDGNYLLGPVKLNGPCKNVSSISLHIWGQLTAVESIDKYSTGENWITFESIDGLSISGNGSVDGQGASVWHLNDCIRNRSCRHFPNNFEFINMTNTLIEGIASSNSKFYNFGVLGCKNFTITKVEVMSPAKSPNTDGVHVEESSDVTIRRARFSVGGNCISLGQGISNVVADRITCGPGAGISVGDLGRTPNDKEVKDVIVMNSAIGGTLNGIKIKSWPNSPLVSSMSNITFSNIFLHEVNDPIVIDQLDCPYGRACRVEESPSKVKIRGVLFKSITGTSSSELAVTLRCSSANPCEDVKLADIHIVPVDFGAAIRSTCYNIKPQYDGQQVPSPCPV